MMVQYYYLISVIFAGVQGVNILGIFTYPLNSSRHVYAPLIEELAKREHRLTVISPFQEDANYSSIEHILVTYPTGNLYKFSSSLVDFSKNSFASTMQLCYRSVTNCDHILGLPQIQKLISSKHLSYDLILLQVSLNDCLLGFAHKFQAPVINICSHATAAWMSNRMGNPYPYAYVPFFGNMFTDHMNFWQRFMNSIQCFVWSLIFEYHLIPRHDAVMRKHFNDSHSLPGLWEMMHDISLLMTNSHFSINYPKPLVPSHIELGGLQLKPPNKLPSELQILLDGANEGIIYFSFGSGLKASNLPTNMINAFLEAFSKVKQIILWKWDTNWFPETSNNVKLIKWLPQSDTLAHRNVRLFITHGGLLSLQEATYHGVPLLGIPFFADQFQNIGKAVNSGFCVHLDTGNISRDSVLWALNTALQPKYRENAQRMSRIFRDQPLTPLAKAVYWTEYVIRHKGARHMRSAALDLTWYQYFLLDVIAALVLFVTSILFFIFKLIRTIIKRYFSGSIVMSADKKNE